MTDKLTILIGGNTAYAFSDPDIAGQQHLVMVGANLDVDVYRNVTPASWAEAKAIAIKDGMDIVERIDDTYTTRVRKLDRMPKAALAKHYKSLASHLWSETPPERWSKDELVSSILRIEFPRRGDTV